MVKQDIGLCLLSSSAVFGAWSAWNSSYFTIDTFVTDEAKVKSARTAMLLGLATSFAIAGGIYGVFGEKGKFASLTSVLTGAVLYGVFEYRIQVGKNNREVT